MDMRIGGRAGHHAIEVIRKLCHLNQSLTASGRAAVPVGVLRALAIVGLNESFRLDYRVVYRAPSEVHNLFRMPQSEHAVAALMAGVGGSGGVPIAHRSRHLREADNAGPAAIADHLEF